MDSPETNKIVASTSSSPPVQDSPFFNYLRNLSPIKPAKVAHVARGLAELNFPPPPPVFTSPRVNPQPETNFVNRSQFPHSSNAELSFNCDNKGKTLTPSSDVSRPPVTRSMVGLISCSQKRHDSKGSVQVQPCSPSGFVDEYLADPVEGDSVNSPDLDDLCLNHTNDAPQVLQSGCMRSKETIMKLDDYVGDTRKDMETKMAAHNECSYGTSEKDNDLVMSNLSMESDSGVQKGQHFVVQVSTDSSSIISKTNERDIAGFDKKRAAFSESLCHHKLLDVKQQNADGEQKGERECNPQSLPEHLQIVPAYESCDEDSGALSNELVENRMLFDYEDASQHQRGMLRRCLQFEAAEARRNTIGSSCSFRNPKHIPNSKLPAKPTESKIIDSSHMESSVTSNQKPPVHVSQPTPFGLSLHPDKAPENYFDKIDRSVRNIGNTSITAPMPSGIGLHLNSVVNSTSMGCSAAPSMKLAQNDYSYSQIEKSPSLSKPHLPQESKSNSFPTSAAGKFSANNDDDLQESQAIVTESSAAFHSSHSPTTQINTLQLEVIEHHTTSSNKRKSESQNTDRLGFNEPSPKKKRKKESYTVIENEGCKRCNCRRSKCLKLYCDCFAAGIYCSEPCACQECFNKPEYEDMVLETRQQIESRNPLAFAPKIVRRVTESPVNSGDDDNRVTPSSARHKRGCNCKKSMCLKKYCECYQAGVGCSIGCRCEGCKNVFGIKEGYREITEMVYKRSDNGCWEDESEEQLDIFDTGSNFLHPEQCRAHNLSPLTPLFQFSSREKDVPKPRLPARQYLPSPESDDNNILTSYGKSPRPLRSSNSHDMQEKKGEGNVEIVSYDLKLECSVAGTVVDQFSPRWDGLADLCNFTPLPHPPTSRVTSSSSSSSNNTRDHRTQVSGVQLCRESVRLSSVGSLHWHSSPVTPMPHLGETKMPQEPDSESRYEILEDDDTPEILKDTPTPIRVVKVSSPNQKRVSPPHSRLHELRSNSSPGLRSGRKFVLQSISSFPPLTPYSDPKGDSNDK